jgi:cyclophilin family peptidyl-prolyl cis-trans isomerase
MLVNDTPGSVANFMALADTGYYSPSLFHRVVPNFVAQGGDPRGDGWGGEDYSIRSEIGPLRYQTGSVGMASAGKDTEGVQWFINHSPTPHLDGRYSIFAVVTSGMEVVHQLEMGDEIISIERVQ